MYKYKQVSSSCSVAWLSVILCIWTLVDEFPERHNFLNYIYTCTVSNIIEFTYYHCTSIDYSVHCEWSTLYYECNISYKYKQVSSTCSVAWLSVILCKWTLVDEFPERHNFLNYMYTCTHVQYLTLLNLHTITVLPLTTVYFVSEVYCTLNVLHSITP